MSWFDAMLGGKKRNGGLRSPPSLLAFMNHLLTSEDSLVKTMRQHGVSASLMGFFTGTLDVGFKKEVLLLQTTKTGSCTDDILTAYRTALHKTTVGGCLPDSEQWLDPRHTAKLVLRAFVPSIFDILAKWRLAQTRGHLVGLRGTSGQPPRTMCGKTNKKTKTVSGSRKRPTRSSSTNNGRRLWRRP
jgi:hypothetical protein